MPVTQSSAHSAAPPVARPLAGAPGTTEKPPAAPISPEALQQLELAHQRARKIRRAVQVALFNGWTIGFFAALSLLSGIFSLTGFVLGVALAIVSYNEFKGAKLFRRLDLRAPRRLGWNQLGLCGVLIVYSLWCIYSALTGPNPYEAALPAGGQAVPILNSIAQMQTTITLGVYGSLIIGSIIFQGTTAWYYFTRARHIQAYIEQTPQWVIDLQQASAPL